jgi:taurine--2-oxoglutarate transaminase
VRELDPAFEREMRSLADHEAVSDVRGRGFLWGVEFADPETGEPFVDPWVDPEADNPVRSVIAEAADRGALLGAGRPPTQAICAPPLCADEGTIEEGVGILSEAIREVF